MQVSWEHSTVPESFFPSPAPRRSPSRPPAPRRPPVGPPPRYGPAELAPGPGPAPFPGSRRRWMEAGIQGQGRGARGPGAPLCAQAAPPPPAAPSTAPGPAPGLVTVPGLGNCISGPRKLLPVTSSPKPPRARGKASCWGGVPGPWGCPGISLTAAKGLKGRASLPSSRW